MTRVSKYKVDKLVEQEMFQQFWKSLTKLKTVDEVASFLSDFLTETEEIMLAKRFAVAVLLIRGKRPIDIVAALHVSYALTGSVASWVKNAKPHTRQVLQRIMEEQELQALLDRVEGVLEALPPRYGSNWTMAAKERFENRQKRRARARLE